MSRKKQMVEVRANVNHAIGIATEIREVSRAYRETLETMFRDEAIPSEVRQQYERLLVKQLTQGGVF